MNINQMLYFLAVAEELHFGRAARKLHICQPSLRARMHELEEELGGRLFQRDHHDVSVTEAGTMFRKDVEHILRELDRSVKNVRALLAGDAGEIIIGYSESLMNSGIVGQIIRHFQELHPHVKIRLRIMPMWEQEVALLQGDITAAFYATTGANTMDSCLSIHLGTWAFKAALPRNHPLAERKSIPASCLHKEHRIIVENEHHKRCIMEIENLLGIESSPYYTATNAGSALVMVESGIGYAIIPDADKVSYPDVVYRPIEGLNVNLHGFFSYRDGSSDPLLLSLIESVAYWKSRSGH